MFEEEVKIKQAPLFTVVKTLSLLLKMKHVLFNPSLDVEDTPFWTQENSWISNTSLKKACMPSKLVPI